MLNKGIVFEGGDGVGKNYLSLHTIQELTKNGYDVVMTNFPQYFSFGSVVRRMNRGFATSVFEIMTSYEQAKYRGVMYALDRVLSILPLQSELTVNPNAIYLSDRGPDSNAVTAAYIWQNDGNLTNQDLDRYIDECIVNLEPEFRSLANSTTILCMDRSSAPSGVSHRGTLDILETSDVQTRAIEIYNQVLGPDATLYTKEEGSWRPVSETTKEVLSKANIVTSESNGRTGELTLIGPLETAASIFKQVPQELIELDKAWREMSLDANDPDGQRKHKLDVFEAQISEVFGKYLLDKSNLKVDVNILAVSAIKRFIEMCPQLLDVIRVCNGEAYAQYIEFVIKLGREI